MSPHEKLKINPNLDCKSKWVIYVLEDIVCNKQYVGSAIDMKARWCNHKSHIKSKFENCNVVTHWWEEEKHNSVHPLPAKQSDFTNQIRKELKIVLVDKLQNHEKYDHEQNKNHLLKLESSWETKLHTLDRPHGLNIRKD